MTAPPRTQTANAHAPGLTTQSLAPRLDAPSVAAALPVPTTEAAPIAVFDRPNFADEATSAARHWRVPFRLLSFVIVVAMPTILAGVYYFLSPPTNMSRNSGLHCALSNRCAARSPGFSSQVPHPPQ